MANVAWQQSSQKHWCCTHSKQLNAKQAINRYWRWKTKHDDRLIGYFPVSQGHSQSNKITKKNYGQSHYITYLLNLLCAEVHIRPTPEQATAVYLLMFSRASPRSGYVLSFLAPLFFSRFLSVFLSPVFHLVSIWEQIGLLLSAAFSRRGQSTAICFVLSPMWCAGLMFFCGVLHFRWC